MKFNVNVNEVQYGVETAQSTKLCYIISYGLNTYEIALSADGDWICHNFKHGAYPLPVAAIGEAIQTHFETHH